MFNVNHNRRLEYYGARAAHVPVLRPGNGGTPEVFVQNHGDGSIGALHIQLAYRRRGLDKVVLTSHFLKYKGRVSMFGYIMPDNTAMFDGSALGT
ncbi:hypothetical protein CspHIS471_0404930 [Cutaneotrichosporon sp. HIS471]|nr:hypothetical protein CspHIS471_0404930 [Cutaneotrichosporon sp. HIS471]